MRAWVGAAVASVVLAAPEAFACSPLLPPPPPPPRDGVAPADAAALGTAWAAAQETLGAELRRQLTAEAQRALFDRAGSVLVARLDRIGESRSVLAPVLWLKGEPVAGELAMAQSTWTTCGPVASRNGVQGEPGEVFVVYLKGRALLQAETLDALKVAKVVDPETLKLLTAAMLAPQQ